MDFWYIEQPLQINWASVYAGKFEMLYKINILTVWLSESVSQIEIKGTVFRILLLLKEKQLLDWERVRNYF